jgi:hypothetical protein
MLVDCFALDSPVLPVDPVVPVPVVPVEPVVPVPVVVPVVDVDELLMVMVPEQSELTV